ncbi:MAG: O-antigen ligase family protein [Phycisphaerales bacterium]|nr:O-antigen ligase family protein [Phycisphaerales bacterium]
MAWGFLQSITNAGEAIAWGALLAFAIARLPKIWWCYRSVWRDPLWWTVVAWALWWALAATWGPDIPGRSRVPVPERWLLTPLILWPVMGRPWLVLGAMALGGAVQSAVIVVLSWDGSGWQYKLAARGLSALSQSQWQTATALVLSAWAVRFGSWHVRVAAIVMLASATLGVLILAVRTMAAGVLAGIVVALSRAVPSRRAAVARLLVLSCAAFGGGALLAWSPAGATLRAAFIRAADAARDGSVTEAAMRLSSSRLTLAHAAIDIGVQHPILGGGRGAFTTGLPQWALSKVAADPRLRKPFGPMMEGTLTDAHNAVLQAWVDGGIPAAALLCAMLVGLAVRLWRQSRISAVSATALALYTVVLVNVPGGIITAKSPGALIAVCLSISWLRLGYRVANPITAPGALPRSRLSGLYM